MFYIIFALPAKLKHSLFAHQIDENKNLEITPNVSILTYRLFKTAHHIDIKADGLIFFTFISKNCLIIV